MNETSLCHFGVARDQSRWRHRKLWFLFIFCHCSVFHFVIFHLVWSCCDISKRPLIPSPHRSSPFSLTCEHNLRPMSEIERAGREQSSPVGFGQSHVTDMWLYVALCVRVCRFMLISIMWRLCDVRVMRMIDGNVPTASVNNKPGLQNNEISFWGLVSGLTNMKKSVTLFWDINSLNAEITERIIIIIIVQAAFTWNFTNKLASNSLAEVLRSENCFVVVLSWCKWPKFLFVCYF